MSLALRNISAPLREFTLELDVEWRGRLTAVFGPSGAGKTTLLNLVAGLRRARAGLIELNGIALFDSARNLFLPPRARGVGYVPQDLALFPHLSVRQNLLYGHQRAAHRPSELTLDHVSDVLEIGPLLARRVTNLSGGERQRVALGRALLSSPRLLLLDEPFANLDVPLKDKIIPHLTRVRDEFRIPMLYVTHDRFEVLRLADEMSVLVKGQIQQTGPTLEVFNHPANAVVAQLVGAETFQPGRVISVAEGVAIVEVGRARLVAPAPSPAATDVYATIRGEDVTLQKPNPSSESSARNRLLARVVAMPADGPFIRVELDAGFPLFALITRSACAELHLQPGVEIACLIKASAVHLVPR